MSIKTGKIRDAFHSKTVYSGKITSTSSFLATTLITLAAAGMVRCGVKQVYILDTKGS